MKISHVEINHLICPIGYDLDKPTVSWIVEDTKSTRQISARMTISKDPDMKMILYEEEGDLNSLGTLIDIELKEKTRYYIQIYVRGDQDEATSEITYFEIGKLSKWESDFITTTKDYNPIIGKIFQVSKPVKQARIYICGLGVYEAYLNDSFVNQEYLMPGYHSYDTYLQYQTYDITSTLQQGENTLEVMLADGWYKGRLVFDGGFKELYGTENGVIFEIDLTYQDGTHELILSDEACYSRVSPVVKSGIYDGETLDANLIHSTKKDPVRKANIDKAKLRPRLSLPILIQERIKPNQLIITPKKEFVLDFGQNITGWVEFTTDQSITLTYSEIMQEGCFYNENYRDSDPTFHYISDGMIRTVRPHSTFYGFRYVKVEGMGKINLDDFTACLVTSNLMRTGYIETGHSKVNKLIENAYWSQRDNFLDVPTDCPQRDERLGWTGDAQIFCATASYNANTAAFYTKYLKDMLCEQLFNYGGVPYVVPQPKLKEENFMRTYLDKEEYHKQAKRLVDMLASIDACPWADAATIIPWTLYEFYGDMTLLEKNYVNMAMWVDHMIEVDKQNGNNYLFDSGFHFADWLALDNPDPTSPFGKTDMHYVASVFYYYSTWITSKAAKELGREQEASYYQDHALKVKEAILKHYFKDGLCTIDTQTAYVLAIHFNLVEGEDLQRNVNHLRDKIKLNNGHLDTGFVGTPYLNFALSNNQQIKQAYDLLLNEDYPSWLYEVNLGATTIWERWNSVLEDGSMNPEGMNSLNHYAYGSIVEWIYKEVGGLKSLEPGFKKALIEPKIDSRLHFAKIDYLSNSGKYHVEWKYVNDHQVIFDITIPFNTVALVRLPTLQEQELTSGTYHFDISI